MSSQDVKITKNWHAPLSLACQLKGTSIIEQNENTNLAYYDKEIISEYLFGLLAYLHLQLSSHNVKVVKYLQKISIYHWLVCTKGGNSLNKNNKIIF